MRNIPNANEPRSCLIIRRTQEAIRSTGLNVLKFAGRVADSYRAMIPPGDRIIDFHESAGSIKSALKAEKLNGNLVDNVIKGVTRFAADLEEPWVAALPPPHRENLVRELAARYGLVGTRMPSAPADHSVSDLASLLRDVGAIANALAPALSDGKLTMDDAPQIRETIHEIDRCLADVTSLRAQLAKIIGLQEQAAT